MAGGAAQGYPPLDSTPQVVLLDVGPVPAVSLEASARRPWHPPGGPQRGVAGVSIRGVMLDSSALKKVQRLEIVEVVPPGSLIGAHWHRMAGGPAGEGAQLFHEPGGALESGISSTVTLGDGPRRPAPALLGQPLPQDGSVVETARGPDAKPGVLLEP